MLSVFSPAMFLAVRIRCTSLVAERTRLINRLRWNLVIHASATTQASCSGSLAG